MEKILQLGNLRKSTLTFNNPQCGRVYSINGISPTINTCQGGEREPKVIVIYDTYGYKKSSRYYNEFSPALRAERSDL